MTRRSSAIALALTIALGLATRRFPVGVHLWDKSLGDALYTVMLYFLVALVRPTLAPRTLGGIALALSLAIEAFQLTGIPSTLPRIFRIVLGTTFAWHDVACYIVGAVAVVAIHRFVLTRSERAA